MSIKCLSAILGRKWLRQFYGQVERLRSFGKNTHVHKIPLFRGGHFGFWGGGARSADFIFVGARIFLTCLVEGPLLFVDCALSNSVSGNFHAKGLSKFGELRAPKIAIAYRRVFVSQTSLSPAKPQWGRFLLEESQKESQSLAILRRKEKLQGFEGHYLGPKNSCDFDTCIRKSQI